MTAPAAVDQTRAVSRRSLTTRAKLVGTAEQLFAEHGVVAVSLNEISRAAEQRHSNVCQYHFGDKDGLIQAVIDKHVPGIAACRNRMFEDMAAAGEIGLAETVRGFVRPVASKLKDPDGGVAFIRFSAQMIAANVLLDEGRSPYRFSVPEADILAQRLTEAMGGLGLPQAIIRRRLIMASIMLFQGLAVYSRIAGTDAPAPGLDFEHFTAELEAMIIGALTAPAAPQRPTTRDRT
jgi:AcrR family transcriptional regulator